MKFEPLPYISEQDALQILKNGKMDDLRVLPFSLGEYCENWEFAEDICAELIKHTDLDVRVNAVCGLSYVARNHRKLHKERVENLIFRAYREPDNRSRKDDIRFSIDDIYLFMGWTPSFRNFPHWLMYKLPSIGDKFQWMGLVIKDAFGKRK